MNQEIPKADVTIVGAGIVGIHTALQLQRKGFTTVLVDRHEPAAGCSSGNAGIIATYGVTPVSMPGLWKQVPKMLLDPSGPLSLRWQHLKKITPWLFRFWRQGNVGSVHKNAAALESLVHNSLRDYQALTLGTPAAALIKASPLLCVYSSQAQFQRDQFAWDLRQKHGVTWSTLQGRELQEVEPALADSLGFAVVLKNTGFTLDPLQLGQALFQEYIKNGGKFVQAEVRQLSVRDHAITLGTTQGSQPINKLVVACGAWSGILAQQLGEFIPIEAERGYHVTLSDFEGLAPRHPIMSPAHKVISTPMSAGLRIAGMVEFGGFLPPDYRRSSILQQQLSQLFPNVKGGTASSWMGHRPTLPDSLPVISQSARHKNVFYAFGHQHVGLTAAPMTATLIANLIAQQPNSIDMRPFRVDRF